MITSVYYARPNSGSTSKAVELIFPDSNIEHRGGSVKSYILSLNETIKSDFLKSVLELEFGSIESENIDDKDKLENNWVYCKIEIPSRLYYGIREHDISKFISYWIGNDRLFNHEINDRCSSYVYKDMASLGQALCMNDDLNFICLLNEHFKPY